MDDLQKIDNALEATFKKWSSLIANPCIPADTGTPTNNPSGTGVSVSFAGDWLPRGRVTFTNVSQSTLNSVLQSLNLTAVAEENCDRYWRNYGDLFLYLYWKLHGRNTALAYHVLHGLNTERQIYLDLTPNDDLPTVTGTQIKKVSLGILGKSLELTPEERKCFLEIVFKTQFTQSAASPEELQEFASELARQMRKPDGGLDVYLNDRALQVRATLHSHSCKAIEAFTDALLDVFGLKKSSPATRRGSVDTAFHMLQLLYLYQPLVSNHAYYICPSGSADKARVCFVFWQAEAVSELHMSSLLEIGKSLATQTAEALTPILIVSKNAPTPTTLLNNVIGSSLEPHLRPKMNDNQRPWLGHYLVLCQRLADVAVHEGKKLGFSFFVSSGEAASKEIEFVSSLSSAPHRWQVDDGLIPAERCEEIISRLLGNYSFLQSKGSVIQASWWGHLLALSRLLDDSKTPEELTRSLHDAYLILIDKNRDIKVFFEGALVLWRRGARWVVPKLYGDAYVTKLEREIGDRLSAVNSSVLHELCTNAWELSHHERGGACFVLADLSSGGIDSGMIKMTDVFPFAEGRKLLTKASRKIFQDLAIQDGATLVDTQNGDVYGRRQIAVRMSLKEWDKHIVALKNRWPESHKILRWGTRHLNALRAALHFKGAAVLITVSSDGDIHLFDKDGPVQDATYPGI